MSFIAKLLSPGASAKIRRRLLFKWMQIRGASPVNATLPEVEAFFSFARENNRALVRSLAPYIKPDSVLFDVGANAGFFAREILEGVPGFHGTLVMFEPISHMQSLAVELLNEHTKARKIFVNSALGNEDGEIDMFLPPNMNMGWITAAKTTDRQKIAVKARCARASQFVADFKPDVIKVDVEGYEGPVLSSILDGLGERRPVMLFELEYHPGAAFEALMQANLGRLRTMGYRIQTAAGAPLSDPDIARLTETVDLIAAPD